METCQLTPAETLIIVLQVLALKISIHILLCYTGVSGSNFTDVSGVLLDVPYLESRIQLQILIWQLKQILPLLPFISSTFLKKIEKELKIKKKEKEEISGCHGNSQLNLFSDSYFQALCK